MLGLAGPFFLLSLIFTTVAVQLYISMPMLGLVGPFLLLFFVEEEIIVLKEEVFRAGFSS